VALEDRKRVVPVVAGAVVEGEDEAVGDRRAAPSGGDQGVRLERLVVAQQVLDLTLEVRNRAGGEAVAVRVADVVVHDQDRAHFGSEPSF
jgi:hypothetical protein